MIDLYLLRHGQAIDHESSDSLRPLSQRGEEEAERVALVLRKLSVSPGAILSSPLLRAQQTAAIVRRGIGMNKEAEITEYLTPSTDQRQIIGHLNMRDSPAGILLVSHEPFLSVLISQLVGGSRNVRVDVGTGCLACVRLPSPIATGSGVLRWLLPQQAIRSLLE